MTTQAEELEKLYAIEKEYKIPKNPIHGQAQATLKFKPLSLDDMATFNMAKDAPINEVTKSAIKMVSQSLGITEEVAGKISFEHMTDILDIITELNNLPEKEKENVNKVKDFMRKKKEQIAQQKEHSTAVLGTDE